MSTGFDYPSGAPSPALALHPHLPCNWYWNWYWHKHSFGILRLTLVFALALAWAFCIRVCVRFFICIYNANTTASLSFNEIPTRRFNAIASGQQQGRNTVPYQVSVQLSTIMNRVLCSTLSNTPCLFFRVQN